MTRTILDKIIGAKRFRLEALKRETGLSEMILLAENMRRDIMPNRLRNALRDERRPSIIAEFKRASPSKGIINDRLDPAETAFAYNAGGAIAISVLSEEDHFLGSLDDLMTIRNAVDLPLLRKDFIVDEYQIYESAAAGADAVLLIAAALTSESLKNFQMLAASLGLDAIVEVHDRDELRKASDIGAEIIGVNNRNLKTFEVSLDVSRELIKHIPNGTITIAESGLKSSNEVNELHSLGYDGFLVGETLMRSKDISEGLRQLTSEQA